MLCPQCKTPLEDGSAFCGNCGVRIPSVPNSDATIVSDKTVPDVSLRSNNEAPVNSRYGSPPPERTVLPESYIQTRLQTPATAEPAQKVTPPLSAWPARGNTRRNILLVLLLLLLIAGGTVGALLILKNNGASGSGASGQVSFFDNQNGPTGHTDALSMTINGLSAPPSGSQYDAWLFNDQNEQVTPLGTLVANGQKFSLSYTGPTNKRHQNTNLIGLGNRIEITQEQGSVPEPTSGKIVLSGTFPPKAFVHIRHLLFAFPTTPANTGLLVGLRDQTQKLNGQALLLQNVAGGGNQDAIKCAAQSIIDISEGSNGAHFQQLGSACAFHNITDTGDGFGILGQGYLTTAAQHAALAANQSDSTQNIRTHAGNVEIAMSNIRGWVTTVDADALKLLANPTDTSVVQEMVNLSDHAFHGVDVNGDGQVDPVKDEAGAITAYIQGQLMATLPLS